MPNMRMIAQGSDPSMRTFVTLLPWEAAAASAGSFWRTFAMTGALPTLNFAHFMLPPSGRSHC